MSDGGSGGTDGGASGDGIGGGDGDLTIPVSTVAPIWSADVATLLARNLLLAAAVGSSPI